jgi:hypothetical protein
MGKSATGQTDYSLMRQELFSDLLSRTSVYPRELQQWRISLYLLVEEPRSSRGAKALSIFLLAMIVISIVCFIIETMPELKHVDKNVWLAIEIVCTAVFTVEYITRLLVCSVTGKTGWQFVKETTNVFDLMAVLPFYLWVAMRSLQVAKALGVLRIVRMVRLLRIFKLGRYFVGLQLMMEAMKNSSQALWVLSFFLCISILLFSSAIYYVEKMGCPDIEDMKSQRHIYLPNTTLTEFDRYYADCRISKDGMHQAYGLCCDEHGSPIDFPSIIEAFWWSTVTMTTVGFGDVYPRTVAGQIVGEMTMVFGILLIALPVAIIGRNFQEVYDTMEYKKAQAELMQLPSSPLSTEDPPSMAGAMSETMKRVSDIPVIAVQTSAEGPTLHEMSRRLRLMKMPDNNMTQLALDIAEELDEAGEMQQEIKSMYADEKDRQRVAVDHFDQILKRLVDLTDPDAAASFNRMSNKSVNSLARSSTRGLTKLVVSAVTHVQDGDEASPPSPLPEAPLPPDESATLMSPAGTASRSFLDGEAQVASDASIISLPGVVESPKKASSCASIEVLDT